MNPGSFAGIARRTTIDGQRRATYVLAASNASLPIPSWAQGGKGIVRISGCGGGASGAITSTSANSGAGGGAGALASDHPLLIPSGVTTLSCQIGAGGTAVTAGANAAGVAGGSTSVTAGATSLTLEGGLGADVGSPGLSSRVAAPLPNGMATTGVTLATSAIPFGTGTTANLSGGVSSGAASLGLGAQGGAGNTGGQGWGAGAWSPWGAGGTGRAAGPTVNTNGANASGFGAGGSGATWISGGTVTSGAGAPGLLILEFVEGF